MLKRSEMQMCFIKTPFAMGKNPNCMAKHSVGQHQRRKLLGEVQNAMTDDMGNVSIFTQILPIYSLTY
jgi:hypothetical protein